MPVDHEWQFPNRTEQSAADRHGSREQYLALPWASRIDQRAGKACSISVATRQSFHRSAISEGGLHTVCQHVYWRESAQDWVEMGVTDVWLSHAAESGTRPGCAEPVVPLPRIHPWPLYAVNVEESDRRGGIVIGKNPRAKKYLASFIGAHMPHYISDSRLRLDALKGNPSFFIKHTGDQWHFHGPVHEHQINGKPLADVYKIDESVSEYNEVLSDSVFALCPAGAGRNTIRLWEAMAVGAIPVLIDEPPLFPKGGSLPPIDWDKIVIQLSTDDIPNLPLILRKIPMEEIKTRQRLAMEAYAQVRVMRCF